MYEMNYACNMHPKISEQNTGTVGSMIALLTIPMYKAKKLGIDKEK